MRELYNKIVRESGKVSDFLPIAAVLSVAVAFLGAALSGLLVSGLPVKDAFTRLTGSEDVAAFAIDYFEFIGIWVLVILVVLVFPANRKMMRSLAYNGGGNSIRGLLLGAVLGFAANGVCVLLSVLSGDIVLTFNGLNAVVLLLFIVVVFIQSGAEELVDRFYLYQKLRRRYRHPLVAIVGSALVFMAMHISNQGFGVLSGLQILVVGILFALMVYYYDALWVAMAFHAMWNFTQNIIFGLPNSGIVSAYSVFKLEAASAKSGLFYSVNFGVEGSIGAVLILTAMVLAVYLRNRKRPERSDLWASRAVRGKHARIEGESAYDGPSFESR